MNLDKPKARSTWLGLLAILLVPSAVGEAQTRQVHLELDGDLVDSSGNGRDGVLMEGFLGTTSPTRAPVGAGLELGHDAATLTSDTTDGAYVAVPYRLTDEGTIALWYRPSPFYNYQSIWDNSGDANDWEMWIYNDGRLRARVDGNVGHLTQGIEGFNEWHHIAYTCKGGVGGSVFVYVV